jgi:hypothetical protein
MEEVPEIGKELSHSAHGSGMNESMAMNPVIFCGVKPLSFFFKRFERTGDLHHQGKRLKLEVP